MELKNLELIKKFKEEVLKIKNELIIDNFILKKDENEVIFEKNKILNNKKYLAESDEEKEKLLNLEWDLRTLERNHFAKIEDFERKIFNFAVYFKDVMKKLFDELKIEDLNNLVFEKIDIFKRNFKILLNYLLETEFNLKKSLNKDLKTEDLKYFLEKNKENRVLNFLKQIFIIAYMLNDEELKEKFKTIEEKDFSNFIKISYECRLIRLQRELNILLNEYEKLKSKKEILKKIKINDFEANINDFIEHLKHIENQIKEKKEKLENLYKQISYLEYVIENYGKN